eukprot:COSAG04_NODE_1122_length_8160_cov_5.349088_4_plen_94_part_00
MISAIYSTVGAQDLTDSAHTCVKAAGECTGGVAEVAESCEKVVGTEEQEAEAPTTCTLTAADAAAEPPVEGSCTVASGSGSCTYVMVRRFGLR